MSSPVTVDGPGIYTTSAVSISLPLKSNIFLKDKKRGDVGLKEKILGIFLQFLPDTLITFIALLREFEAEENMVSKLLTFKLHNVSRETLFIHSPKKIFV